MKFRFSIKCLIIFLVAVVLSESQAAEKEAVKLQRGSEIFAETFDEPGDAVWSKAGLAQLEKVENGSKALKVTVPTGDGRSKSNIVMQAIDLSAYRGFTLSFEAMVKAKGVTKPKHAWNGVKFMLRLKTSEGFKWYNANNLFGTFDWKPVSFLVFIPKDTEEAHLCLGLQDSSGQVWFDDIKARVGRMPPPERPKPQANPGPVYKGHSLPRLRGMMSPNKFCEEDMRVLGQDWNANLIRWQITRNWGRTNTDRDLKDYDRWIEAELTDLEKMLVAAKKYGLKVVVDLHSPPGGRYQNGDMAIFHEKTYQKHFIKVWELLAKRLKGNPAIWGYDLINEPVQTRLSPEGLMDFLELQTEVAKRIREIDPDTTIIIEPDSSANPGAFTYLQPVDVPGVVYQVHMYVPHKLTHQGVSGIGIKVGARYPGEIDGVTWNEKQLRQALAPVREFQKAYNVHIYVGEFSCIRWAPGKSAFNYLRDCIKIFEEYDWDWSYHAYREWDGWSVEHGNNPNNHQKAAEPTDRYNLFLDSFSKNKKPKY